MLLRSTELTIAFHAVHFALVQVHHADVDRAAAVLLAPRTADSLERLARDVLPRRLPAPHFRRAVVVHPDGPSEPDGSGKAELALAGFQRDRAKAKEGIQGFRRGRSGDRFVA